MIIPVKLVTRRYLTLLKETRGNEIGGNDRNIFLFESFSITRFLFILLKSEECSDLQEPEWGDVCQKKR